MSRAESGYQSDFDDQRLVREENAMPEIPEGVVICSIAEASVKYKELFEQHYNQYTKPADADGLVALNTAFAQDGVFVYVPDRVVMERPLQIVNLMRANADLMSFQRNMVILGRDAKATILVVITRCPMIISYPIMPRRSLSGRTRLLNTIMFESTYRGFPDKQRVCFTEA